MTGNIPMIHPLPGTTVEPRRLIVLPEQPTFEVLWAGLRTLLEAAVAGEPSPVVIYPLDDGAPPATFGQSSEEQEG